MLAVVVVSGGMDSTTLLYDVYQDLEGPHQNPEDHILAISFDYGQRHKKELEFAWRTCNKLNIPHKIVDITNLTELLAVSGSSLVSDEEVPEGHYGEESMKQTVVPNRNMIMSSIAAGAAIAQGADALYLGVHSGDHFIYPDCRPRFFYALNAAIVLGNEGFGPIGETPQNTIPQDYVLTPYINKTKADIAYRAIELGVPFEDTWSCYQGGAKHCGRCGTCVERLEAIDEATERLNADHGVSRGDEHYYTSDKTEYEDSTFWREAVQRETV